jgi:hypothetical protein
MDNRLKKRIFDRMKREYVIGKINVLERNGRNYSIEETCIEP